MPSASTRALVVVSDLAAGQWGLLTTAQAAQAGVTRLQLARLADAGVLERVIQGIYATAASPTEHREVRAAWLALDPALTAEERLADPVDAGVASHASAAALHQLGDLLDDEPELTLPRRKQSRRGVRLHRLPLHTDDVTLVDGLPTTTAERTAADLLRDGHDPKHVATIIGQGVRRGVIDVDDLAARLDPLAHRHGHPDGRALVEHLLDLVGLSTATLARELAASAVGQELIAAGRYSGAMSALSEIITGAMPTSDVRALRETITGAVPTLDMTPLLDDVAAAHLRGIDFGKLISLAATVQSTESRRHGTAWAPAPVLHTFIAGTAAPAAASGKDAR